ncbi:hypothetical protein MKD41_06880 [Lutibacter sp. A64]|uniref:hypothetical protein n=1 Tax=Lutibacter sp. A64 TaxID=2918526 RepID=UPI001F06624F|nr:hypothetical protein [Lutibacter sp. A64]UMB55188.1 hypothetical protein MKD41_06880 [Lutibacter sp. A64]
MKNCNRILIIVGLFFISTYLSFGQQLSDENTVIINQYFQLNNNIASNLKANNNFITSNNNQQTNEIINLNQLGDNNIIEVKQIKGDNQVVKQVGDNNYYSFINYYNSNTSNLSVMQIGNSNSLNIYGQNSLIDNMSILQKSNFKTLIIKNY